MTVLWGMVSYICLWFGIVLARQLWCKTFYCRIGVQPLCCVTPSLLPSLSSTLFDQWDSRVAAAVCFCAKACVTANCASLQAAVAEGELQHLCSTAGGRGVFTGIPPVLERTNTCGASQIILHFLVFSAPSSND